MATVKYYNASTLQWEYAVIGSAGPQGITGAQGIQGIQGLQGTQGIQGITGSQGIQGTKGDQGAGVTILGSYSTLTDLQTSHPTGNLGDGYVVGSDLYVWNGSAWFNVGPLQGPQGTTGTQGTSGSTGSQGATGSQGTAGAQGLQGIQGTFGPATVPQNAQTSSYTLIASDNGKHISITTGGVTVPASVFSTGDNIVIYNNSASNQTITQGTSVTLRYAGTATTGNRTLAGYGICTVLCITGGASPTFVISGTGLS